MGIIALTLSSQAILLPMSADRTGFDRVKKNLISGNHGDLIRFRNMGKSAPLAVPTLDHYLPMIFAIAMQGKDDALEFIYEGFQNRSVSMRCFKVG